VIHVTDVNETDSLLPPDPERQNIYGEHGHGIDFLALIFLSIGATVSMAATALSYMVNHPEELPSDIRR